MFINWELTKSLNARRCLLFFVLIIFILYFLSCGPPKRRVIKGGGVLKKTLFYRADISKITHITQGPLDKKAGSDIGICSFDVMHIVDPDSGSLKSKIKFNWTSGVSRPEVIYTDREGYFIIMDRGISGDVGLMDHRGNPLWIYKPKPRVSLYNMDVGDLDKNGELEFYVATYKGLHQLSASGKKQWNKGGWVYDVNIFDPGDNKAPLAVTHCQDGHIQFRNYEGDLIREIKPKIKIYEESISEMELVEWASQWFIITSVPALLSSSICVLDLDGNVILRDKVVWSIYDLRTTTIKLYEDQAPYLAVVVRFAHTYDRSMLCIYSPDRKLFYKEIIKSTTGLLAKKKPGSKCETLLVGDGPGRVYEYRPQLKKGEIGSQ